MLIGYARVSTDEQNLNLQRDSLNQAGCGQIFEDQISGVKADRPRLTKALEYAREGDVITVWRLDRLSRSMSDLIELINQLESRKIGLKSITESIDTSTTGGKLVFHIFGALAEFERNLIRERTNAGLAAARARGRLGGRPPALTNDKKALAIKLYNEKPYPVKHICAVVGCSPPTLYKYVRQ